MSAPSSMTRSAVVLLVQPERDDRGMYAEFLEQRGLQPVCRATVADALPLARQVDVVVTGILLPGSMDGLEFVARLRSNDDTKRLPIIVLTAAAWDSERARAERVGCDVFLPKPCLPDVLLGAIRRLLRSAKRRNVRTRSGKVDGAVRKQVRGHRK